MNSLKYFIMFPLGTKQEISRLDELFIEDKYHPIDDNETPMSEVLAIPLERETLKKQKKTQSKHIANFFMRWLCANMLYMLHSKTVIHYIN